MNIKNIRADNTAGVQPRYKGVPLNADFNGDGNTDCLLFQPGTGQAALMVPDQRRGRLRIIGQTLVAALLVIALNKVEGYSLEGPRWPSGTTVHWQVRLKAPPIALQDGTASYAVAFSQAMGNWNPLMANVQINGTVGTAVSQTVFGDGVNTVCFSNTLFGKTFGDRTLAVTQYNYSGPVASSTFGEVDMVFNNAYVFDCYHGALQHNSNGTSRDEFRRVATHELGHSLGLDHPDKDGQSVAAIMNSFEGNQEIPTSDDTVGVQSLYGARGVVKDINGDGNTDYILHNPSTGRTVVWYLNNNIYNSGAYGPTLPAGWRLVDIADFNGDGHPDYVLFNPGSLKTAIWYLSGPALLGTVYGPTLPSGWQLVAIGRVNADLKPDYILYHPSTGRTAVWYLSNNIYSSGAYGPTLPAGWRLVDMTDFNGDGHPDYVLFNPGSLKTAIWYMSGPALLRTTYGPTLASGYELNGAADFDGDGNPDYVLYDASTGGTVLWYLNDSIYLGQADGPTIAPGYTLDVP